MQIFTDALKAETGVALNEVDARAMVDAEMRASGQIDMRLVPYELLRTHLCDFQEAVKILDEAGVPVTSKLIDELVSEATTDNSFLHDVAIDL